MTSRFAAMRVRPAHGCRHAEEGEEPQWLLLEWLAGQARPSRQWLSTLPPSTDLASLVRMVKIRWWIEQGYQQLKDELGLDHYEGRRWQGWHHHVTLTMMAFAFLALERLRAKKTSGLPSPRPTIRRDLRRMLALWTDTCSGAAGGKEVRFEPKHYGFGFATSSIAARSAAGALAPASAVSA